MIVKASEKDYDEIARVWEASVRATHHFLPEDYLQEIKGLLPVIFPSVPIYIFRDDKNEIHGFLGVAEHKIEMLFIRPDRMRKGIGQLLTEYAINQLQAERVDVNEQNEQAVGFYQRMGFVVEGRSDKDGMGRPFPLLQMKLVNVQM